MVTSAPHPTPALLQYRPVCKPNQLICGSGQTAVVTGWTLKGAIAKKLNPSEYAVIGQLYSPTRGINFLVRNLLANPHVRYLVILNATREDRNAKACDCLRDFLVQGFTAGTSDTGKACWVVNSSTPGYIDQEVAGEALEVLRQSLEWREVGSIPAAIACVKEFAARQPLPAWGDRREFPLVEPAPTTVPGPRYGHRIEGKTIAETWVKIIHRIKTTGTIRPTLHDSQWQELINLMAIVTDEPEGFYFPEPNYLPVDRSFIQQYIAQILDDAPHQDGVKYTYGQRLRSWFGQDQIQQVIHKLVSDRDTARAVMSLWDVNDHDAGDSPPCLNHLWVRIVDHELSLTATFRSNDMFSAWVANAMGLRALQQHLRDEIVARSQQDLRLGPLVTISQSAHIYDDCWENADRLIATQYPRLCQQRDYNDPSGSFVISLQGTEQASEILVEHMTPGSGEVIGCYSGKTATHLYQQIAAACPGLQVEHALYLGAELKKAEIALALGQPHLFEQDKPLRLDLV
ncbi:MAG TPA: thymidylate synthase [Synechococcales cyanobacterium M55_K2018_004]|nr:thymidylate synthase [Synechococcales cyanobacterium M55_K2018_004]